MFAWRQKWKGRSKTVLVLRQTGAVVSTIMGQDTHWLDMARDVRFGFVEPSTEKIVANAVAFKLHQNVENQLLQTGFEAGNK